MWRMILAIPCWIAYQVFIFIPLMLLGWIVVPIATALKAYRIDVKMVGDNKSTGTPKKIFHFTWKAMFIWDNVEDGIYNDTYWKAPNVFLQIVYWSCLRNPVNNLRVAPVLSCKIKADKVRFLGSFTKREDNWNDWDTSWESVTRKYDTKIPQWFFAWQNIWHSNFYWQFEAFGKLWRFWIGNAKVYPTDIFGGPYGYREVGAGPVAQFKRVKT